jgi:hypothetical protein
MPGFGPSLAAFSQVTPRADDARYRLAQQLMQQGSESGPVTRETVAEGVEGLSDEAREALRIGVRSQIDDVLANVKAALTDPNMDVREAAKALKDLSSRASREKLALALGEREAAQMFDVLDQAFAAFQLRASVVDNSKTAVRRMMDARFQGVNRSGVLRRLARADPIGAGQELVGTLTGNSTTRLRGLDDRKAHDRRLSPSEWKVGGVAQ